MWNHLSSKTCPKLSFRPWQVLSTILFLAKRASYLFFRFFPQVSFRIPFHSSRETAGMVLIRI